MMMNDGERAPRTGSDRQENPMSKGPHSDQSRMFSRRLIKIMTVMERFREEAEGKGHQPFADALRSCTMEIAGGNMDCPLGKLVVDESARTGVFMAFNASGPAPQSLAPSAAEERQAPHAISPITVLDWQSKHTKLWSLLKEDARLAKDADCLEALEACNDLTQNHRCPVRELIVRGLWHGDKS